MKKTLLTLVLAFCVLAGQGQTSTTASGVNSVVLTPDAVVEVCPCFLRIGRARTNFYDSIGR